MIEPDSFKEGFIVKQYENQKINKFYKIYHEFQSDGASLLEIEFQTVTQYLNLLEKSCRILNQFNKLALIYLSAAVSDFYIPDEKQALDKISSTGKSSLTLTLYPVPKLLGKVKSDWAPNAFVVSFKLETDEDLLVKTATNSLLTYGQDIVVANLLATKTSTVQIINRQNLAPSNHSITYNHNNSDATKEGVDKMGRNTEEEVIEKQVLALTEDQIAGDVKIEELLVREIVGRHEIYISSPLSITC
ncbi:unnamed protein product [Gordionus sp. m RMFG-2023]